MIVEYLSDHAGTRLEPTRRELVRLEAEKEQWEQRMWAAAADHRAARAERSLPHRILGRSTTAEANAYERYEEARRHLDQFDRRRRQLDDVINGESGGGCRDLRRLETALKWLTDDWTLINGYRNRIGRIDHVLVGPAGVWAVNVQAANIRLQVSGDWWVEERVDRRGRVLNRRDATDRWGRTWGRQVGAVARELQFGLQGDGLDHPVRTAVILLHRWAQLGSIRRPGVDYVGNDHRILMSRVAARAHPLSADQVDAVVDAVRRHHLSTEAEVRRHHRAAG